MDDTKSMEQEKLTMTLNSESSYISDSMLKPIVLRVVTCVPNFMEYTIAFRVVEKMDGVSRDAVA